MPESIQFAAQHLKDLLAIVVKQSGLGEVDHRNCSQSLYDSMDFVVYRVSVGDLSCVNAVGVMLDKKAPMYIGGHDKVCGPATACRSCLSCLTAAHGQGRAIPDPLWCCH